jgi:hypothetical protein
MTAIIDINNFNPLHAANRRATAEAIEAANDWKRWKAPLIHLLGRQPAVPPGGLGGGFTRVTPCAVDFTGIGPDGFEYDVTAYHGEFEPFHESPICNPLGDLDRTFGFNGLAAFYPPELTPGDPGGWHLFIVDEKAITAPCENPGPGNVDPDTGGGGEVDEFNDKMALASNGTGTREVVSINSISQTTPGEFNGGQTALENEGYSIKEGIDWLTANAIKQRGTAVLVGGTVVVSNSQIEAASQIHVTTQTPGGTPGWLHISTRTAGTSFTILSSSGTDTSTVAWFFI